MSSAEAHCPLESGLQMCPQLSQLWGGAENSGGAWAGTGAGAASPRHPAYVLSLITLMVQGSMSLSPCPSSILYQSSYSCDSDHEVLGRNHTQPRVLMLLKRTLLMKKGKKGIDGQALE